MWHLWERPAHRGGPGAERLHPGPRDTFVPYFGIAKELDLRFSIYYGSEDFTETIDALASGALDPTAMVTDTIGLDELPTRFAALAHEPDGGTVILRP